MSYNLGSNRARIFKSASRFALDWTWNYSPITPWIVLHSFQLLLLILLLLIYNNIGKPKYQRCHYPFSTTWRASLDSFALEKCWKILFTRADGILGPDGLLLSIPMSYRFIKECHIKKLKIWDCPSSPSSMSPILGQEWAFENWVSQSSR